MSGPEAGDGEPPELGDAMVAEQVRMLVRGRVDLVVNLVNAAIVAETLWPLYPAWLAAGWLVLFYLVVLFRYLSRRRYGILKPDADSARRWGRLFTLNAFATAVLWGATGSAVLLTADPVLQVFVVFNLAGMVAGGIVSNAAYMPPLYAFAIPTLLPVILIYATTGGIVHAKIGAMIAIYLGFSIWAGHGVNRSIRDNLRLRIAQDLLLRRLRASEATMAEAQAIAHVGSWSFDVRTHASTLTDETYRIFGIVRTAVTPSFQSLLGRVHPEDLAVVEAYAAGLRAGRVGDEVDHRIVMDDGTIKYVNEISRSNRDADGTLVTVVGTVQDITERRLASRALAYRENLLHAVTLGIGVLVRAESLDPGMHEALRIVGESLHVDRIMMMQEVGTGAVPLFRYVWQMPGNASSVDLTAFNPSPADVATLAVWRAKMHDGSPLIAQLAGSTDALRGMLEYGRNQSTLMVPIFVDGTFWGNLAADSCVVPRVWTEAEIDTLKTFGGIAGALLVQHETRAKLEASERHVRVLNDTAQDAIITIHGDARIGTWNHAAERILGYTAQEAVGRQVHEFLVPPRFKAAAGEGMRQFALTGAGNALGKTTELSAVRKDGTEILVELSLSGAEVAGHWEAIGVLRDITARKAAAALALRMARYDVLTGLANRAVFVDALDRAIAQAKRGGKGFAVIYMDLDHFKDVNDTLGHPVGDLLLAAVADLLRANTRATDTVARFGGDEFAIVVADIANPADAAILADKLLGAFAVAFAVNGSDIHTGASIGIALYDADSPDAETLLSHADVALYRAKSEGRSGWRFFTEAMNRDVQSRVELGVELREAIEAGQLFLMYQPQVEVETGRITGLEALVRWRHPTRGVLAPDLFIPIAEQIGLIAKLGHFVLWAACRQAKTWREAGIAPVRIAVNVSALQFRTPAALEADITAALADTQMPAPLLELELTETVLMDASREHADVLERLRARGVTIAIDDFGTGYSSLGYLHRFPSSRIKIAQDFVKHLETTPDAAAIVRATIGLARELGLQVIAEGVETAAQAELLKRWGCNEVQGFHFARPLAVPDATAALRAGAVRPGP
jgi:diguanylate cyclase (GGDEF)-like protein/PAS domain S-box-containing protein